MRDRLIELLKGAETKVAEILSRPLALEEWLGVYADHLLADGVIVPPCKVGDTVFYPFHRYWCDGGYKPLDVTVEKITVHQSFDSVFVFECGNGFFFRDTDIGKTVFLTREEAEKALAEREGKG